MALPVYIRAVRRRIAAVLAERQADVLAQYATETGVELPAVKTFANSRRRVTKEEYYKLFPVCVVASVTTKKQKSDDDTHFSDLSYQIAIQVSIIGSDAEVLTEQIELYIAAFDYLLTDAIETYVLLQGVPNAGELNVEVTDHDFAEIDFEGENEYLHTGSLTLSVWKSEEGSGRR